MKSFLSCVLAACVCSSCVGMVEGETSPEQPSAPSRPEAPRVPSPTSPAPTSTVPGPSMPSTPAATPAGPAFTDVVDRFVLLPFNVRLTKLALVAGVTTDDASFAMLKAKRYELGDHNFGQGIAPDLTWSSRRMGVWMQAVTPVCKSAAMRRRFPNVRARLDDFILAAYGRTARPDDGADLDMLATAGLDEEQTYTTSCVSLLSTAEFVGL